MNENKCTHDQPWCAIYRHDKRNIEKKHEIFPESHRIM